MKHCTIFPAALAATALLLAAGCTSFVPKYEQPPLPVENQYAAAGGTTSVSSASPRDIAWADFFGDPRLRALIQLSLDNNRDLRVAALRVEQYAAQYRIARAPLLPNIGGSGAYTRSRTPYEFSQTRQPYESNQFTVGLGLASYEIDFFGRIHALKESALETYLSTDDARRTVQLTLIASVAAQYLLERSLAEQLAIATQTLALVESSRDLIQHRFDAGTASDLDLATAQTQVYTTQAVIADLTRQVAQSRNALVLLLGAPIPANLPEPLPLKSQNLIADLLAGVPSDLLARRPDITAAEHTLRASNANIGAARAAFFPSISLTASGGFGSTQLADLFKGDSFMWSFAPKINVPIFTGGALKANLEATRAAQKIMLAQYEKAIQSAFREVSDALVARETYATQITAIENNVSAQQRRYDLSDIRYKQGVDNYLTVITAQQSLIAAQQSLVQARYAQLVNQINLYKALGGDWQQKQNQTN